VGVAVQLKGIDTAFLALESPTSHLQAVGVVRLDPDERRLGLDELIGHVDQRLPRLDVLHRQLVTVPGGLDRPYWIDVRPDLPTHIRHRDLAGHDAGALEWFCAERAGVPFDRNRPMWELWLVDGLADGGQALVFKIHHSLCDGIGTLALVAQLFDQERDPPEDDMDVSFEVEDAPGTPWLLAQAAQHAVRWPFRLARVGTALTASALRVGRTVNRRSGADLAAPLATPSLPYDGPISPARSVAMRDLPFDRVRRLAKESDTRINDVVLAVLAGTLRHWLLSRDVLPEQPVVAAVPVSTRQPDELFEPGNYVSALFAHLPTNVDDPAERLAVTAAVANGGKEVHAALGNATLERLTSLAFPLVLSVPADLYHRTRAAERHPAAVNLVVSNVAGPPLDLYLTRRKVKALYALGPIFDGVGLNITAVSFNGGLGISYIACPDRLPDLEQLADGQAIAFEELAAAHGV
jgi:WS/DGAT/MGAT family acyltransferase